MKLSDFLLYLKTCGEATISVEDAKKLLTCDDEGVDVKVLHIEPPICPEIRSYYEGKADEIDFDYEAEDV